MGPERWTILGTGLPWHEGSGISWWIRYGGPGGGGILEECSVSVGFVQRPRSGQPLQALHHLEMEHTSQQWQESEMLLQAVVSKKAGISSIEVCTNTGLCITSRSRAEIL